MRIDENVPIDASMLRNNIQGGNQDPVKIPVNITNKPEGAESDPAASVEISEKGRNALQNSSFDIQNKRTGYTTDEMYDMAEKSGLKKGVLMTDYYYVIPSKLNEMSGDTPWVTKSYEEKTRDLLGAYASIYDDIVKGYEAGTREVYVEDLESETGYRKLTMEEEINELDKAFAERTDRLKRDYDNGKRATADIAAFLDRLAKAGARVDKKQIESTSDALERYSRDEITEEFADRLKNATVQIKQHLSQGGVFNASFSEMLIRNFFKKKAD